MDLNERMDRLAEADIALTGAAHFSPENTSPSYYLGEALQHLHAIMKADADAMDALESGESDGGLAARKQELDAIHTDIRWARGAGLEEQIEELFRANVALLDVLRKVIG